MQINMWTMLCLQGLKGNMTTLNCIEEVDLAKKLVTMHPWADKVRSARSGGEANSIAIRLARASTKTKYCLLWLSWLA